MTLEPGLTVFLILSSVFIPPAAAGVGVPGKPRLTSCRSPDKETFTCWWEPGDDRGLPTTFALYYLLEGSQTVYECPDYRTAGPNSCFFSKNDTSLWVNYNITVVATNGAGRSVSEPVEVDVVYIVQPNTPENVAAAVEADDHFPYLRVWWEKPRSADTRSGWITLVYQLRVKQVKEETWEEFDAGMQKHYKVFSLLSGEEYMLQVRCKPDHGFWSEWTDPVYVQIPEYMSQIEKVWIIVAVISGFVILIITWTMSIKRNSVKHCLLPPVPGPKIKGIDEQLLKSGRSEEVLNALVIRSFPPTTYEELHVDYLEVYADCDDKHDSSSHPRQLPGVSLNPKSAPSDSDSGRGSCDSQTLLAERGDGYEGGAEQDPQLVQQGKVQTWPGVSPSPRPLHHYYQQDLYFRQAGGTGGGRGVPETSCTSPDETPGLCGYAYTRSTDVPESDQYVEVQRVDRENVLLQPLTDPEARCPDPSDFPPAESYSKVQDVTLDNLLLLQGDVSGQCQSQAEDERHEDGQCRKPNTFLTTECILHEGMRLTRNGYVDSTAVTS